MRVPTRARRYRVDPTAVRRALEAVAGFGKGQVGDALQDCS